MNNITVQSLIKAAQIKGYAIFDDDTKPYNLNIWGIRAADLSIVNKFNDSRAVFWKYNGNWNIVVHEITTKPGLYYLQNPFPGQTSTFILKEGQYRGSWAAGLHAGQHPALIQTKPVTGYRDGNLDAKFDIIPGSETTGIYGIDLHGVWNGTEFESVSNWSAGCQVTKNSDDHDIFMDLCYKAKDVWGNSFSYTLINQNDLVI